MASAAQISANRRNAQMSTGLRTEAGKSVSRFNALIHGMRSDPAQFVLPHEDPTELERRIQEWTESIRPRNAVERDLTAHAARLTFLIERADRYEAAQLSKQILDARAKIRRGTDPNVLEEVHELAKRLLYCVGRRNTPYTKSLWQDYPEVFLCKLESTVEGCDWLIARWKEFANHLNRADFRWLKADQYRFVRLLGRHGHTAVHDPELNRLFLAWEVIEPGMGRTIWTEMISLTPVFEPGYVTMQRWREISERPADRAEADALFRSTVAAKIERLESLRAEHIAAAEFALDDRESFDASPAAGRLHRYQAARNRELMRTLDQITKIRKNLAIDTTDMMNGPLEAVETGAIEPNLEVEEVTSEPNLAVEELTIEPKSPREEVTIEPNLEGDEEATSEPNSPIEEATSEPNLGVDEESASEPNFGGAEEVTIEPNSRGEFVELEEAERVMASYGMKEDPLKMLMNRINLRYGID